MLAVVQTHRYVDAVEMMSKTSVSVIGALVLMLRSDPTLDSALPYSFWDQSSRSQGAQVQLVSTKPAHTLSFGELQRAHEPT